MKKKKHAIIIRYLINKNRRKSYNKSDEKEKTYLKSTEKAILIRYLINKNRRKSYTKSDEKEKKRIKKGSAVRMPDFPRRALDFFGTFRLRDGGRRSG
jgi:hypothetical protein